jgi:type IV fimbrial biogenesis protein FimT
MAQPGSDRDGPRAGITGVTLPELLIALAVIAILAAGGFPRLAYYVQEHRMAVEVNRFVLALQLARNEAVKRGRRTVICPANADDRCADRARWENGWLLFASENRERESGEPLIRSAPPLAEFIGMRSGNHRKRIVYQTDGSSGGTNSSFTFCDGHRLARPRVICLSNTGRPRVAYTRCDGSPVACP